MLQKMIKAFRERLTDGEAVLGPFMKTGDPAFVEAAGYAGFDFVILDTEHGPVSIEQMQNNVRAALLSGALPIIRTENADENAIGKALDIGAAGIQVPQISTAEQAREAVRAARFYPQGMRGVCRFVRAAQYGAMDRYEYFKRANEALLILQLEGREAIENLEDILTVEGIDILFIGPYDLSQSLGIPGQVYSQTVTDAMRRIATRAAQRGITVGTFLDRTQDIALWKSAKVQYLSYSVDVGLFLDACRAVVAAK